MLDPRPCAAPAHFPYAHRTLDQVDTTDPARWREANRAHFDAMYGPGNLTDCLGRRHASIGTRRAGLDAARQWRLAAKPHFDALYGAEGGAR